MAQQLNSILKDFIDMRKSLHKSDSTTASLKVAEAKTGKKLGKTKEANISETLETSLARIIEEKSNKKEVCD